MQEVFYRTWLDTYPNIEAGITIDDIEDRFKTAFTEESLASRIDGIEKGIFAKAGDNVIGVCFPIELETVNQLRAIYVLPDYQRHGTGLLLWNEAQKKFNSKKDVIVHVATYNAKAIAFIKSSVLKTPASAGSMRFSS